MFQYIFISFLVILYVIYDVNYFLRTIFTVMTGRLLERRIGLNEKSRIYGMCTFQDCDITFRTLRLSRIIRELDFARYHFYDRTGIYLKSKELNVRSLQGSTYIVKYELIPIFVPYVITTKLTHWDDRSLFFEHELITIFDSKTRAVLVSRQYALCGTRYAADALLEALPGCQNKFQCPEYIKLWLESMEISSKSLRKVME